MKAKNILGLIVMLVLGSSCFAQEMTFTATEANIISNRAQIDMPGLAGNPSAIIIATPIGNTAAINPHPTGAWYYNGKWHIHNTNAAKMPVGAKFQLQVFLNPNGNDQFIHITSLTTLNAQGASYINNPALNNNPNAQFKIFQNHGARSPSNLNSFEARAIYENGQWLITNPKGPRLGVHTAYNIVLSASTGSNPPPDVVIAIPPNGTVAPNTLAGGDLSGIYPNPTVKGLVGRPLSTSAPTTGQILKWNGTQWIPATETTIQTSFKAIPNGTAAIEPSDAVPIRKIPGLAHTIRLERKSQLVITAVVDIWLPACPIGCSDASGNIAAIVDNTLKTRSQMLFTIGNGQHSSESISSYMVELDTGTHIIEFQVSHSVGRSLFQCNPQYSSVIVIPL